MKCSLIDLPNLISNLSSGKLQQLKMLNNGLFSDNLIGQTYKQAYSNWKCSAIVPDYQCHNITRRQTRKQVLNEKEPSKYVRSEIIEQTSAMITGYLLMCISDSADVHKLFAEVRSHASTSATRG